MATFKHMRPLRKLRSESGASILLALAVMLVCTMVASVVLMAAAANAGKSGGADARNRAFYSVSSAAQMLASDFKAENPFAEVSSSVLTYRCQEVHPSYVHDVQEETDREMLVVSRLGARSPLLQTIDYAMRQIDPLDSSSTYSTTLVLHAPEMDDVEAEVIMDYEYNITIKVTNISDAGFTYAMTVDIPSIQTEPEVTTSSALTDSHWDGWEYTPEASGLSWKETTTLNPQTGNYEPLSNEYGSATEQLYEVVTTTTTYAVAWGTPSLSKGVS